MFRFKQFTIQQDRTAMKVCTDACVLGAYANVSGERILDIGTGTGLLALMAAQRNSMALVDAVEIDDAAFGQAVENVANSPFNNRVRVVHSRIQDYAVRDFKSRTDSNADWNRTGGPAGPFKSASATYDRILTNPPFYTNHLRSPDTAVNRALHTDDLPFAELIEAVGRLLKAEGQWWVLLPPYEAGLLEEMAAAINLKPFQRLQLRHHPHKPVFRMVTGFAYEVDKTADEILDIYEVDGCTYTAEFKALLQTFYLIF